MLVIASEENKDIHLPSCCENARRFGAVRTSGSGGGVIP